MFVGGEFYEDTVWVSDTPTPPTEGAVFLNGGRACLSVIADYLCANNFKHVLLPAYLCPSILDVFEQHFIGYSFYKINSDFSIDLDDLLAKAANYQVLYLINYFGFQHSPTTLSVFHQLQENGMLLIEDNAQAGFPSTLIGNFCFNSMRKVCACDGGYMATRMINQPFIDIYQNPPNRRVPIIREYRRQLRSFLFDGRGNREQLDRLFCQAEHLYEQDGVIYGDSDEQKMIERLDWSAIKGVRRSNYAYLLKQIIDLPGITPIFPTLQPDMMPLGLPVYVSGISRDRLINLLADESISLTVHWDALLSDARTQNDSEVIEMANHILTLPVDQFTNKSQLNYLVDNMARILSIQND